MRVTLTEFIIVTFHELFGYILIGFGLWSAFEWDFYIGVVATLLFIVGKWTNYSVWRRENDDG